MKISEQIQQFNQNLGSLKEFAELKEPFLLQRKEKFQIPLPQKVMSVLELMAVDAPVSKEKAADMAKIKDALGLLTSVADYSKLSDYNAIKFDPELMNNIEHVFGAKKNTVQIISNNYNHDLHIFNLYKNNLISLLSTVEWFFAQLLHNFYDRYPESPGINKKTLTFEDLKSFESLKDAERYLIEKKVEELLRGSIDSWFDYLRDDLKIKINFVKPHLLELIEISQRRNLFVHNGGIVNTIYLSKVDKSVLTDLSINQPIEINKNYIEKSINLMQMVFTFLAAELWKKLDPKDSERGDLIGSIAFEYLMEERWQDAYSLSTFLISDDLQDASIKTIAQLNAWLCKKKLGSWKDIDEELKKTDFSDKLGKYQIALASLKENYDLFFELLPGCISRREITFYELELFPIFQGAREHPQYGIFKENILKGSNNI